MKNAVLAERRHLAGRSAGILPACRLEGGGAAGWKPALRSVLALIAFAVPLFASSPEYPVGSTVPAAAPHSRNSTAAATDGTDFFVVWSDGRSPGRGALVGTRVKNNGDVLDPLGIRIASGAGALAYPAVAWDGDAYVVAWTQEENVHAARIDREGHIVTAPRVIAEDAMTAPGRSMASNGNLTAIAYRHVSSGGASRVAVLDRELDVLHREALTNRAPGFLGGFSIAATPSRFVVAWSSGGAKISAIVLGSDGRAVRTATEIGTGEEPVVATDGTTFTLVSRRLKVDRSEWVLVSRTFDADLVQLGLEQTLADEEVIESLSLLWRGDRYEVLAGHIPNPQAPYGILSIELDRDGDKIASRTRGDLVYPWFSPQPVAATNGSDLLVAYAETASYGTNILARIYRGSSSVAAVEKLLSLSGNTHAVPQVASSPSGHLAAWSENGGVYVNRIDASGNSLDGRGIRIGASASPVRVAFDGTNYVVAWRKMLSLGVAWVSPATGATVAETHAAGETASRFALAVSPDATYVAYEEGRIYVTRIPHATHRPGEPLAVSPEDTAVESPAISWNGSTLLVAWNELLFPHGPPVSIFLNVLAARVTPNLTLLDPAPIVVAPEIETASLRAPAVASNAKDWLVVTDHYVSDVLARRVLDNGNVEGAAATKIADGFAPDVTWDGTRYAIAFKGGDRVEEPLFLGSVPASGPLPMMRRTLVATDVVSAPSVARTANGDVAVVYTKLSFRPEHAGVERSYLRVMELGGRGRVVRR